VSDGRVETRLALEHRPTFGIGSEVRKQPLDDEPRRQVGIGRRRMRQIDFSRTADRDARVEEERAETKRSRHRRRPKF
jgi:hypothetical protein